MSAICSMKDTIKALDLYQKDHVELAKTLKEVTALARIKYGNLDPGVDAVLTNAELKVQRILDAEGEPDGKSEGGTS